MSVSSDVLMAILGCVNASEVREGSLTAAFLGPSLGETMRMYVFTLDVLKAAATLWLAEHPLIIFMPSADLLPS